MRCVHIEDMHSCIVVMCHAADDAVQELSGEEEEEQQQQAEQQEADAAKREPAGSTIEAQKRARADSGVHHGDIVTVTVDISTAALLTAHVCTMLI
jgi:hypothetical protein